MRSIDRIFGNVWLRSLLGIALFLGLSKGLFAQPSDSLGIKIGQMILIGFPGTQADPLVLEEIRQGKVGAVIMFEKNIPKSGAAFASLKKIIWSYQKAATIPLLFAIDQEGGKVNRLKEKYGFPRSITAQDMGRSSSLDSVRFYAQSTAATLAGLGINVNFAPVLDLGVNKQNTVIYTVGRAFSANPDSVALLANEFIKAHRRFGVITVLKHFPGHGSSMADTHYGVADVSTSWTAAELIPYQRLISAGAADAVMTAHIVNKQLDPRGYPGTLSSRMIDSLLRKQLRYDGVVFSDDMQMQAIAKQYGLEESIRLSINAGVDLLCFSNNIQGSEERTVDKVHAVIRGLVDNGQIKAERIEEAYHRIMKLKKRIILPHSDQLQVDVLASTTEVKHMKDTATVKQVAQPAPEEKKKKRKK